MAWEPKYPNYGIVKIEGKNVRVYCTKYIATTLEVGEEVSKAVWEGKELRVTLINGQVKKYSSKFDFVIVALAAVAMCCVWT